MAQEVKMIVGPSQDVHTTGDSDKMAQEVKILIGPSQGVYMIGDPGDGVNRKIFLFGVGAVRYPNPESKNSVTFVEFIRTVANKFFPEVFDLFMQVPFQTTYYDEPHILAMTSSKSASFYPDNYMGDAYESLAMSLMKNKTYSKELMRVHYTEVQLNAMFKTSPYLMRVLISCLVEKSKANISQWLYCEWPEEGEIENTLIQFMKACRIGYDKLAALDSRIRTKFIQEVFQPVYDFVRAYLKSAENKLSFYRLKIKCMNILLNKEDFDETTQKEARDFCLKLVNLGDDVVNTYTLMRMLKRSTRTVGGRWEISLKKGEPMTHIIGYHYIHNLSFLCTNLIKLGFNAYAANTIDPNVKQACLVYDILEEVINHFCTLDKKKKKKKKQKKNKKVLLSIEPFTCD